ncbi:uncharacterized protein METZ01_LOCUS355055, partial [marine metagenome]
MSDDGEGNTDENTARIDARGNTGVQTNTVIGEINISVQNPEIEKRLTRLEELISESRDSNLPDPNLPSSDEDVGAEKVEEILSVIDWLEETTQEQEDELDSYQKGLLGSAAMAAGENTVARDYFREAITGFEKLGDNGAVGLALYDMGSTLIRESRYEEGVVVLKNARKKFLAVKDKRMASVVTADIGGARALEGKLDEAKKIYRKVRRDSHSPEAVMRALNGLSVLADEVDADYVEAIRLNTKLIKVANSIPDDHYMAF